MKDAPKGYTCEECGLFNEYPTYVHAHWYENLTHTCKCGAKYSILEGLADRLNPEFKPEGEQ